MEENQFHLGMGPIVVLGIYLVAMIGIGLLGRYRSREKTLSDFYLGGSSFGVAVLFLTLFATQYSGNTMLGFAGRSYRQGVSYIVSVMCMTMAIAVIVIYAPRLYRLARRFGYITPSDFIYHRFGSHSLRVTCALLLSWGLANYILEQLVAMGHAVEGLSGGRIPFMAGVLLLVVVMLTYESLGGMRSVAWTDAIQGLLLFLGCSVILYLVLKTEGGLPRAAEIIAQREPEKLVVPDAGGLREWLSTLLLLGFGVAFYPHAIQRIFAAKNLGTLRISLSGMMFMPFATTFLAFLLGYIAISRFPDLSTLDSEKVTLFMLGEIVDLGPFVYWLVVGVFVAIVAAIMSTSDSALLSIQSMVTKDIYKAYLNPKATPQHLLLVGKVFGWSLMALLVTQAWVSIKTESSIWLLIKLKLEFMVQISPMFLLGIVWRRLPAWSVLAGVVCGTGITLVLWVGSVAGFWEGDMRAPWGISAGIWGLAVNYAVCVGGALLAPDTEGESARAKTNPAEAAE